MYSLLVARPVVNAELCLNKLYKSDKEFGIFVKNQVNGQDTYIGLLYKKNYSKIFLWYLYFVELVYGGGLIVYGYLKDNY